MSLYCSYTFTNRFANVRRISNRKERHGNVTASKAYEADTPHDLLVRKGSKGCDDIMLRLNYCVSMAKLTKNIFAYQLQRILANFMQILGLRRTCTRCMCDVSVTYLWRLHSANCGVRCDAVTYLLR